MVIVEKTRAFVILYMGINIGGFVAPLLCGWLGREYGWHYGFGLAGIGMLTGLAFFWQGIKAQVFGDHGLPPKPELLGEKVMGISRGLLIKILAFAAAPIIALMLSSYQALGEPGTYFGDQNLVNVLFKVIGFAILIYLIYILVNVTAEERKKTYCGHTILVFYHHILGVPRTFGKRYYAICSTKCES